MLYTLNTRKCLWVFTLFYFNKSVWFYTMEASFPLSSNWETSFSIGSRGVWDWSSSRLTVGAVYYRLSYKPFKVRGWNTLLARHCGNPDGGIDKHACTVSIKHQSLVWWTCFWSTFLHNFCLIILDYIYKFIFLYIFLCHIFLWFMHWTLLSSHWISFDPWLDLFGKFFTSSSILLSCPHVHVIIYSFKVICYFRIETVWILFTLIHF